VVASIESWLLHLHGPVVYVAVGLLVFFELAIVIGFFIPGEIATITGGVVASQHHANVVLVIVVVVAAATVGNLVGYEVGRLVGPWLFSHRPVAGRAVVVGRFVVVVRALLPGLVGMSGMARRQFAVFSAAGAIGWGTLWVLVGFALGLSYSKVTNTFGKGSVIVVAALVVAWGVVEVRRRRGRRHGRGGAPEPH
jgi:membrane protein DedA with SNARE-associated domain